MQIMTKNEFYHSDYFKNIYIGAPMVFFGSPDPDIYTSTSCYKCFGCLNQKTMHQHRPVGHVILAQPFGNEEPIVLGMYGTLKDAQKVLNNIFYAYLEDRTFKMPKWIFLSPAQVRKSCHY